MKVARKINKIEEGISSAVLSDSEVFNIKKEMRIREAKKINYLLSTKKASTAVLNWIKKKKNYRKSCLELKALIYLKD